jgi:predicted Fe-Mo cluster-binding NifX family protein
MKIAIPTGNQKTIFAHFGRTPGVLIVTLDDNKVTNKEFIPNNFTGHAQGNYLEHEHHEHDNGSSGGAHAGIFNAIGDCDVVIAGGMGRRLYDEFAANNMQVFVTDEIDIDRAIDLFVKKQLDNKDDKCCEH